jgi:hypothetical protein
MNSDKKAKGMCLAWAAGLCVLSLIAAGPLAAQGNPPVLVSPPNGSTVMGPGSGIVDLVWQAVEGASSYEVRITQKGHDYEDYVAIEETTQHSFGTSHEGEFQWQVRALFNDPDVLPPTDEEQLPYGPWSQKWTFFVKGQIDGTWEGAGIPQIEFPHPDGVLVDGNNYRFHWISVAGARQYEVCIDTPSGTECHLVHSTNYEFKTALWSGSRFGATPTEGSYQLRVRAIGENGAGEYCDPIPFQIVNDGDHGPNWHSGVLPIPPPVLLAPPDGSTLVPTPDMFIATLQWEPVSGAAFYEVRFRALEQRPGEGHMGQGHHGIGVPPTSVLTENPFYDLVVPEAKPGSQYFWKVRTIMQVGKNLLPSRYSGEWTFKIGTPEEPEEVGEAINPISFDTGVSFSGPGAVIHVDWKDMGDGLCQVSIFDATGNRISQNYRHGTGSDVEVPEIGEYRIHIRKMNLDQDGTVASMTPPGQGRVIQVTGNATVDGGRRLGDLVNDGAVDSGDAVRALRHSTGQNQIGLTLRDASSGDCNGDGQVDSGDAVYMLRKAVGSNR